MARRKTQRSAARTLQKRVFPGVPLGRVPRNPHYPIAGSHRPFGAYPVIVSPIAAGETLHGLDIRMREISQPLTYPLGGAYLCFWWAYVPMRLAVNTAVVNEVTPSTSGLLETTVNTRMFTNVNQVKVIEGAYDKICADIIARDGQTLPTFDDVRKTPRVWTDWTNNIIQQDAALNTIAEMPERYLDTQGVNDMTLEAEMSFSEADNYEHFVQAFGVSEPQQDDEAKLLWYQRYWTQPTNTIEPSDGAPSSAWTWNVEKNVTKKFRAREPGILMLIAAVRPKMYHRKANASVVNNMIGLGHWVPAYGNRAWTVIDDNDPVFNANFKGTGTTKLIYDRGDIWQQGEGFFNYAMGAPTTIPYTPPTDDAGVYNGADIAATRGEFVEDADIDALFKNSTNPSDQRCIYDGICSVKVMGHHTDISALGEGIVNAER